MENKKGGAFPGFNLRHRFILAKPKKAIMMALYLPMLTLFMCGLVIGIYYLQAKQLPGMLVSPVKLLDIQDKQQIFEMQENASLFDSVRLVRDNGKVWGSKDFSDSVKENFLNNFSQKIGMNFVLSDLFLNGRIAGQSDFSSVDAQKNLLSNIYSFSFENGKLKVTRGFSKEFKMSVGGRISFPMIVDYNYNKQYLISRDDLNYAPSGIAASLVPDAPIIKDSGAEVYMGGDGYFTIFLAESKNPLYSGKIADFALGPYGSGNEDKLFFGDIYDSNGGGWVSVDKYTLRPDVVTQQWKDELTKELIAARAAYFASKQNTK